MSNVSRKVEIRMRNAEILMGKCLYVTVGKVHIEMDLN
jgi:hypothetical protein